VFSAVPMHVRVSRRIASLLVLVPGALAASAAAATGDSRYARANARLARTIPAYPRSKLLVEEPINGEVGSTGFEAVQRIYRSSHAITQRALNRFLARKLAAGWRPRGSTCFVSGPRVVVAVVSRSGRRLGVLIDSRGAARCHGLTGLIGDLVELGYP
jgi:hypothetical protein